jgi:hypothetical protein
MVLYRRRGEANSWHQQHNWPAKPTQNGEMEKETEKGLDIPSLTA